MTVEVFGWIGSAFGITGALLNARKKRIGFLFYTVANIILVGVGFARQEWYNVALFTVFMIIALYGWVVWGSRKKEVNGGIG